MLTIVEATYRNGALILDRHLEETEEGKKFHVILTEAQAPMTAKARFWQFVDTHPITLPPNYGFQREELHER